jgi:potassium-transporting ATPase KdpC subunit
MFAASLRISAATLLVCSGAYSLAILGIAQAVTPATASGSLVQRGDRTIGSTQVAQKFEAPHYLWPRPSAVDYNASGAGGSNKSPANPELAERARELIARHGATFGNPLPAELATASGAGLDPHISLEAALWQAGRVARARGVSPVAVERLVAGTAEALPFGGSQRLVNVLQANLALNAAFPLESRGG